MSAEIIDLYTLTRSGSKFNFLNPEDHNYQMKDVAHHLANVCRYGGACAWHFSVAQHSVLMAEAAYVMTCDPILALDCLIHDASEAYIGDMKKPMKMQIPKFEEIEHRIDKAIRLHCNKYNILVPLEQSDGCKYMDKAMFLTEWPVLMGKQDEQNWYPDVQPLKDVAIERWSQEFARDRYLDVMKKMAIEAQQLAADLGEKT